LETKIVAFLPWKKNVLSLDNVRKILQSDSKIVDRQGQVGKAEEESTVGEQYLIAKPFAI